MKMCKNNQQKLICPKCGGYCRLLLINGIFVKSCIICKFYEEVKKK
jgi:hypothetical protein